MCMCVIYLCIVKYTQTFVRVCVFFDDVTGIVCLDLIEHWFHPFSEIYLLRVSLPDVIWFSN